jgi:Spy/CpxP family protein refolding chaperone
MGRWSWLKRILVAAVAIFGLGTLAAWRHGHHHDLGPMVAARVERMLDEVNATPAQRTKIHAIQDRLVAEAKQLHGDRRADLKDLLAQWDAATPDQKAIHARIDQRAQAMQKFGHDLADGVLEARGVLTPEQRATLSKKWHERLGQ